MVSSEIITRSERDYHRVSPTSDDKGNYPRMNFVMAGRSIGAVLGRSAGAAAQWWMAAGVTPVAAYAPKGAASLAASYVNLANPGTYDCAAGVAPTWDATGGWAFNGTTQYLTTGVLPASGWSMIARFSDAGTGYLVGAKGSNFWGLFPRYSDAYAMYLAGASGAAGQFKAPNIATGVMGFAGGKAYRNGADDGLTLTQAAAPTSLYIGAAHNVSGATENYCFGKIQSVWIGNTTLSAAQMATQSAAMP